MAHKGTEQPPPSAEEIARWRRRFFGTLAFGAVFLIAAALALLFAIRADNRSEFTEAELLSVARLHGEEIFRAREQAKKHFFDRSEFEASLRATRGYWSGIPDEFVDTYVEEAWRTYRRKKEDFYDFVP